MSLTTRTPGRQREAIVPARHRPAWDELPDPMPLLTAARYLGLSENAARRAAAKGEIPAALIGRRLLVSKAALLQKLGCQPGALPPPPPGVPPETLALLARIHALLYEIEAELVEALGGTASGQGRKGGG